MKSISLTQADDWHLHLRDGQALATTVPHAAQRFARAIIMPNLQPAITNCAAAIAYHNRILTHVPPDLDFQPLMTLYLTDNTSCLDIIQAKQSDVIYAAKLYPAGATTHSDHGVTNIENIFPVLAEMQKQDFPLLIHGEVTDPSVDIFDRERIFIEGVLKKIHRQFPNLRIVLEHITTSDAVDFILATPNNLAATITVHHLLINRNHMFVGGIKPHFYCLPVAKRNLHQVALIKAATSGNPKFFLGTDSAPHSQTSKESACGCAGIYTAHAALELYAEVFAAENSLDKLEGFASHFGADFYKLPRNNNKITLKELSWEVPTHYRYQQTGKLIPFRAGELVNWKLI